MKKLISITLCIIFFLSIFAPYANAENGENDACKITLSADKTTLKPGDEVTISVKISDITKSTGITQLISILDYSDSIFEPIFVKDNELQEILADTEFKDTPILYSGLTTAETSEDNPWYLLQLNSDGNKGLYASIIGDPQKKSQIIGKFKLKVKENATATTAKISLKDSEVYDAEGLSNPDNATSYPISNATLDLKINKTSIDNTNSNTTKPSGSDKNTTPSNTNKNKNSNTAPKQNNTQTTNKADKDVPYTGSEDFIPVILIITIISIVSFKGYQKYKGV